MKRFYKFLAVILACLTAFSIVGCGNVSEGDDSKSILYVRYYNAGFRDRWLTAVEKRFEEDYEEVSFEEGKMGVDIVIDPSTSSDFMSEMQTQRSHVYFIEKFDMLSFRTAGVMADITDALTTPLNQSYGEDSTGEPLPAFAGETKSIVEKMSKQEKEYYVRKENGVDKVYAVPYLDCYNGTMTYNEDLFEERAFFFKADNTIGATKLPGKATTVALGVGPDGVSGTGDDGLPRTHAEFFELCKKINKISTITPFVWAGNYSNYVTELANNVFLASAGESFINDMLNGTGSVPDAITSEIGKTSNSYNYSTKKESFTDAGFNDIYKSASLFRATDFIYQIIKNNWYDVDNGFNSAYSHETAQADFFFGSENGEMDYAFLVDGTWWYNEAERYISLYEKHVADRNTRNVKYFPIPKADEATFERTKGENVVSSSYITGIAVKNDITPTKKLLAETFIRYYCTDESLAEFNTIVSTPRGLKYSLNEDQYKALSPYGKSLYDIKSASNGFEKYKVCYLRSNSRFYNENITSFSKGFMASEPTGFSSFSAIAPAYKDNSNLTPIKYFQGILKKHNVTI